MGTKEEKRGGAEERTKGSEVEEKKHLLND